VSSEHYKTAVETELREGAVRTDNCNNNKVFNKCTTFGLHGRRLSVRCLLVVTSRWLQLVYQVSEKMIPTPHPHQPFVFRIGTCEDKVAFCKYAADRQIHCGVSTGHVWVNIHHNITLCCYQFCDIIDCLLQFLYLVSPRDQWFLSHHMRRIRESWIAKDLEDVFRVLVDVVFWPLP